MDATSINEQVALKLGWTKHVGPAPNHLTWWIKKGDYGPPAYSLPDYAGDIKAAWEIVEKMKAEHIFDLQFITDTWYVSIDEDELDIGHADTAPLAICQAFLKLKDAEP